MEDKFSTLKEETRNFATTTPPLVSSSNLSGLKRYNKSAKVLLINPPMCMPKGMPKRCIQPVVVAYISGSLRSVGIKVELLDCIIEG